jgi:Ca-activated chloride channel family protein
LGNALMAQRKDSAAVVQFQAAGQLETNPLRKSQAYHNIGVVCQQNKLYGDAIEAYKQALRLNPNDDETRYNLALCKHEKQKQDQNQQNQNQNQQNKDDQQKKDNQDKQEQQQDQDKQKQQEQKPQMSKENAEQLLNAAMQQEKQTQKRMKEAEKQGERRQVEKNW